MVSTLLSSEDEDTLPNEYLETREQYYCFIPFSKREQLSLQVLKRVRSSVSNTCADLEANSLWPALKVVSIILCYMRNFQDTAPHEI